jgi:hypothetical protein
MLKVVDCNIVTNSFTPITAYNKEHFKFHYFLFYVRKTRPQDVLGSLARVLRDAIFLILLVYIINIF